MFGLSQIRNNSQQSNKIMKQIALKLTYSTFILKY